MKDAYLLFLLHIFITFSVVLIYLLRHNAGSVFVTISACALPVLEMSSLPKYYILCFQIFIAEEVGCSL